MSAQEKKLEGRKYDDLISGGFMKSKKCILFCVCFIVAVGWPVASSADIVGTATIVTDNGDAVSSDRIPMHSSGAWGIRLEQTDSYVQVEYNRLRKITVSQMDDMCRISKGIVEIEGNESFEINNSNQISLRLILG